MAEVTAEIGFNEVDLTVRHRDTCCLKEKPVTKEVKDLVAAIADI